MPLSLPTPPDKTCESAEEFFDRMSKLDSRVAFLLNETHQKQALAYNVDRSQRKSFEIGDKVWLISPKSLASTSKLEPRWRGPMCITQRVGKSSYKMLDTFGVQHDGHLNQLKHFVQLDSMQDVGTLLTFCREPTSTSHIKLGNILSRRFNDDNRLEFLVHWDKEDASEGVWELGKFFAKHGTLDSLWAYCQENNVHILFQDVL